MSGDFKLLHAAVWYSMKARCLTDRLTPDN
jgi:hypothetical protein